MDRRRYEVATALMALVASPLAVSIGLLLGLLFGGNAEWAGVAAVAPPTVLLALIWALYAKKMALPERASELFMPILAAFGYYLCVWIAVFGLSLYRFGSELFKGPFMLLTFPYFLFNLLFSIGGDFSFFPLVNAAIALATLLTVSITCALCRKKVVFDRMAALLAAAFLCLCGVAAFQHYDRGHTILSRDTGVESVHEQVNLNAYRPFGSGDGFNPNLARLGEPATLSIDSDYPRLDGATAAYPVYAAMVQQIYRGLDASTVGQYLRCSQTDEGYERLINGEIDIFFGAQPSRQQLDAARIKGASLTLTPIAKEAFVFFVNSDNPVSSLTRAQIRDIYLKRITNWRDVGGSAGGIMPFQRPENSGSQTVMLAMVMGGEPLPAPLGEEYADGMGIVIDQVADYRNYASAIGYSFRYFATGMKPNERIKLLCIDGIEPTTANIRDGTYPLSVDVYAVTAGSTNQNTQPLIQWILSEQGQSFIETCGYVRR